MNRFVQHQQVRDGIIEYAKRFSDEQLSSQGIDSLVSELSQKIGRPINSQDIEDSLYALDDGISWDFFMKDRPVWALSRRAERDKEAIDRVGGVVGKPISEMSPQEMEDNAIRLFTMSKEEYKKLIEASGKKVGEDFEKYGFEHQIDGTLLLGALDKIHGIKLERGSLTDRVLNTDFGLGYFENIFERIVRYDSQNPLSEKEGLGGLRETFQRDYCKQRADLEAHLAFDKMLKSKHAIAQPQLLPDRTIKVDMMPLAIEFTADDKLVVLGQIYRGEGKEPDAGRNLTLAVYDVTNGRKISSVKTELWAAFDGSIAGATFQGNVSIGSNGIMYIGGSNQIQRFNGNFEVLEDNEYGFQDAVQLLKDKGITGIANDCHWASRGIYQVTESDGIHYFIARPNDFPKCYGNVLVATDGKKIIGKPTSFSPSGGISSSTFRDTARMVISGNDVCFNVNHSIIAVDRSLTDDAYKSAFRIVDETDLEYSCTPSNHCIDSNALLWAVTQLPEEVVGSIKAYRRGKNKGEIATHFYPENHPGGWASARSMAISRDGILAYTDVDKNQINLYQLKEK